MIIAFVQIPMDGPKRDNDLITEQSLEAAKIFQGVKGLKRKYFLNSEAGGGGIYVFASQEEADAWFNEDWADWMKGRFGVYPTLTFFDCPVILDNEKGAVQANGKLINPPWKGGA